MPAKQAVGAVVEETESAESGAGVDPAAMAFALGGASRAEADAFLRDQRTLIAEQRHHLHGQYIQLRLGIWEKRLGVLLRVATAFAGLAIAAGLAFLIWNASASNDLVIDSFQVPPDLAAKGLSGPVVAAKLSDRIAALQAQTLSARAAKSYANGISEGLKLEIPETGVSLFELDRFLRAKLGHDLHIGGEMVQTANGIALTARVGTDGSATVTGAETDMDGLLQKLAEQVYRTSQPYRFAIWLQTHDRSEEAVEVLKTLAASGPAGERAWAYNGWGIIVLQRDGERASLPLMQRGHALDPDNYLLIANLGAAELRQGRVENAISYYRAAQAALSAHARDYTSPDSISGQMHNYSALLLAQQGALLQAVAEQRAGGTNGPNTVRALAFLAGFLALLHEPAAARAALAEYQPAGGLANSASDVSALQARLLIAAEAQDSSAPALERDFAAVTALYPGFAQERSTLLNPVLALALAHTGQFATAQARLNPMPGDCYSCPRARAQVAALQGQDGRADYWFARAAAVAPSSPYAEAEWGRAFLERKQPDAAIEKFTLSSKEGPHFADPLEGWGEALMAKNQSHLALEKFAAAEKYAPNWGRLHLKWGEALVYAGKKDEAKAQFARAAQHDLTPSEKAELAGTKHV